MEQWFGMEFAVRKGLVENDGYFEMISMKKVGLVLVFAGQNAIRGRF